MYNPLKIEDFLLNGIFFITICSKKRAPLFAIDTIDPCKLSIEGEIAKRCWLEIPNHFPNVVPDTFVIMPDHIHGIVGFTDKRSLQVEKMSKPVAGSLSTVIRSYKSAVTKSVNELPNYLDYRVWQTRFYEHRIRNNAELHAIRTYIKNNPQVWIESKHEIW